MNQFVDVKQTGRNIATLCKSKNISALQLKEELHLKSTQSVYRWFRGETLPSVEHIADIAYLIEQPIEMILVFKDERFCQRVAPSMIRMLMNTKPNQTIKKAVCQMVRQFILGNR